MLSKNEGEVEKEMQFRKFGKLDWQASSLGFGCMRLPTDSGDPNSPNITESEAFAILRHAIDSGVNYLDTAYRYHSTNSERVVGRALKGGYRDKVRIATKSPVSMIKTAAEYDKILDEQLQKLDVDHIDFYLFHGLGRQTWGMVQQEGILARAEAAQKAGKIGHLGFSFHEGYDSFEEIINGYDHWAMCQVQYNIMDEENQAGTKGVKLAASKDIAVVAMEPLRGGKLATPVKEVITCMEKYGYQGTIADLALRWVWNHPEVTIALSGMSTMEQVKENLASADRGLPGALSKDELSLLDEVKKIYMQRPGVPCTNCSYCLPCPQGVNIPRTLGFYNEGLVYDYFEEPKRVYAIFGGDAAKCIQCGECEPKCPQSIPIGEFMIKAHEKLG